MKIIFNVRSNIRMTRNIKRHLSTNQAFLEYASKYKDPILIFSSALGGLSIFGGMIAFVVGDRVNVKENLKLLEEKLSHEKELQANGIKILEEKLSHEKELRATEAKLIKSTTEAEMRGRLLDFRYHGDYQGFRDEINKNDFKDPKKLP